MKKSIFIAAVLALLALPVMAVAPPGEAAISRADIEQHLDEAAEEMGLSPGDARDILEQARELKLRSIAHHKGITYEELLERLEQYREKGKDKWGKWCPKGQE